MNVQRSVETRLGVIPVRIAGDGPAVLAVHGLLVDGRLWDGVARDLRPAARLVIPDLPLGAHRRPVPDRTLLTAPTVADALIDILDALELPTATLLGNDTGGALAQIAASGHPERFNGLVLAGCDAFAHFPPPLLRPVLAFSALPGGTRLLLEALAVPAFLADPGPLNLFSSRGFGRELVRDLLQPARTDPGVRADLTAFVRGIRPHQLADASEGLGVFGGRAAVVWSRRDAIFPPDDADRLATLLDTTVTWVDDARTFVPLDRPDVVAAATRQLLTAVAA